jgi:hypothetical protein
MLMAHFHKIGWSMEGHVDGIPKVSDAGDDRDHPRCRPCLGVLMNWEKVIDALERASREKQDRANYASQDTELTPSYRAVKALVLDQEASQYKTLANALRQGLT